MKRPRVRDVYRTRYDRYLASSPLGRTWGSVESRRSALPAHGEVLRTQYPGVEFPESLELVISSPEGLYCVRRGSITKLLEGSFFGIARDDQTFYVFEELKSSGRVLAFELMGAGLNNLRILIAGLSRGIHQIDVVDDSLYVADSYNNRILVINLVATDRHPVSAAYSIWINGGMARTHRSYALRYGHVNSLLVNARAGSILALAHNDTHKTGRMSELLTLDIAGQLLQRERLPWGACHNILRLRGEHLICASLDQALYLGRERVFVGSGFLRGLAMSCSPTGAFALEPRGWIAVGESIQGDRRMRMRGNGRLYVLNGEFDRVATVDLPTAQVRDIRIASKAISA